VLRKVDALDAPVQEMHARQLAHLSPDELRTLNALLERAREHARPGEPQITLICGLCDCLGTSRGLGRRSEPESLAASTRRPDAHARDRSLAPRDGGMLASAAHAQDAATPMALNQAGAGPRPRRSHERLLASPGDTPLVERCEHRYSLGYAYARTGRRPAARAELTRVLQECAPLATTGCCARPPR
jgi:hypothetical protein